VRVNSVHLSRLSSTVGGVLIVGSVGLFAFVDSLVLPVIPVQRALYAAVLGACAWLVAIGWKAIRLPSSGALAIAAWSLCVAIWLLPAAQATPFYPAYVVGDVASMLAPAIILLAGVVAPDIFHGTRSLVFLTLILLFASITAAVLAAAGTSRFEAPHDLLIVALWLLAYRSQGLGRVVLAGLLVLVFLLALKSGSRTPVLLWILSGAYCAALTWSFRRTIMLLGPVMVLTVLLAGSAIRDSAVEALSGTRFSQNVRGTTDESLLARFHEAQDALFQFGRHARPLNYVLGFGHGSTFRPVVGPIRNMTPEAVVHNIHIGPVLVLYRYGLLGLLLYVFLLGRVIMSFLRQRGRLRNSEPVIFPDLFFTLGLGMLLIDGTMRNVIADPVFSYVLAGFLFQSLTTSAVKAGTPVFTHLDRPNGPVPA